MIKRSVAETEIGGAAREFFSTRWTLILSSRDDAASRRAAMEELLASYWKPLYFYARRKGLTVEDAKDVIQDFLTHLLEQDFLSRLDPGRGRFRGYLKTALDHYLINQHEQRSAQKRGGGAKVVSLDFDLAEKDVEYAPSSPEAAYDREWALEVMERALRQLEREFSEGVRRGRFEVVAKFFRMGEAPTCAQAAAECGMNENQFKVFLHRCRERFRQLVRQEVAHTVADGREADAEIAALVQALRS